MITFFDFIIVAFVLFYAYLGWEAGMWTAGIAALELVGCLTLAILLLEPVTGFLFPLVQSFVSSDLSQTWVFLVVFAGLAWGPFAVLRYRFHTTEQVNLEQVEVDPLSDRIGGVIAGGLGGAVFVGGVLITASMIPFLAALKPSGDRLALDVGKLVLMTAGHFVTERPEGYDGPPLPIAGGPISSKRDTRALLSCEPWINVDEDPEFSEEKDRFRDVDGDGSFTKDLYVVDTDRTGKRRIGLIDKYVVGSWDIEIKAPVRKRTDVKIQDPKSKKKKKPGEGDSPDGDKPVESDF